VSAFILAGNYLGVPNSRYLARICAWVLPLVENVESDLTMARLSQLPKKNSSRRSSGVVFSQRYCPKGDVPTGYHQA
jgi:hypothetical protein